MEILEWKNTKSKVKKLNRWTQQQNKEERTKDLWLERLKITPSEHQGNFFSDLKNTQTELKGLNRKTTSTKCNSHVIRIAKGEVKAGGAGRTEKYLVTAGNVSHVAKYMKLQIQEAYSIPQKIYLKNPTPKHVIITSKN